MHKPLKRRGYLDSGDVVLQKRILHKPSAKHCFAGARCSQDRDLIAVILGLLPLLVLAAQHLLRTLQKFKMVWETLPRKFLSCWGFVEVPWRHRNALYCLRQAADTARQHTYSYNNHLPFISTAAQESQAQVSGQWNFNCWEGGWCVIWLRRIIHHHHQQHRHYHRHRQPCVWVGELLCCAGMPKRQKNS